MEMEEEEEEEGCHEETEKNLIQWERLHYPRPHFLLDRSLSDPSNNALSIIHFSPSDHHDRRSIVFPPVNHEGLHISTASTVFSDQQKDLSSSRGYDLDRLAPHVPLPCPPAVSDAERCWNRGFHLLRSKVIKIAFSIRSIASRVGVLLTFHSPAGVAPALLLVLMFFRSWCQRRLRRREQSRDHLIRLIKEKDEKINQLLTQISQMNEIFLALHKAPVPTRPG